MPADAPAAKSLEREFWKRTGHAPEGVWSAPGRATLIGEHLDYNDGHVLPFGLSLRTRVAARRRTDGRIRCWSLQEDGSADLSLDDVGTVVGWARYPVGTVWALHEAGAATSGVDLVVDGRVPIGAGLSSSAALECAVASAVAELSGFDAGLLTLAAAGQRAETDIVGAPVGLMDQVASLAASAGHGVLLDCRSLAVSLIPLPFAALGARLLVIDTRVRHEVAAGEYAARRRSCETAAAALGVLSLRDATPAQLDAANAVDLDPLTRRRARHVLTEEARVLACVDALRARDLPAVGALMTASHRSLAEDYEVSVPALDAAVAAALDAGALGARLTGAGFGGSVVALVPEQRAESVTDAIGALGGGERSMRVYDGTPSGGARRES